MTSSFARKEKYAAQDYKTTRPTTEATGSDIGLLVDYQPELVSLGH